MGLSAPKQMEQGDQLAPKDIVGHTLILSPIEYIPSIKTSFDKADETSQAIKCNVVDFVDTDNPAIYRGVLFFNVSIYNNLKKQIGEHVAGRFYQGQAKTGQSAPWLLQDVTLEPQWMAFLGSWLDNTPDGVAYQAEVNEAIRDASNLSAPAANTNAPTAPPAPAPIQAGPATPPAPSVGSVPPPSFGTPPSPAAPPVAAPAAATPAPAGDFMAMLANLPAEEQAKMLALMQQQGNAAS